MAGQRIRLKDFLEAYGEILKEKVVSSLTPVFSPKERDSWDKEQEKKLEGLKRKPFPAQKDAILALAKGFYKEGKKGLIAVGEMGVGKTLIAIATAYLMPKEKFRVIVMCPPHLVQKWAREIRETIPNAKVVNLNGNGLKELEQLRYAGKPEAREFYILGREKAKLHYQVRKAAWEQEKLERILCPSCGRDVVEIMQKSRRPICECGSPLYCAETKIRRFAKAEFVKKYLKGKFDLFIADEVHELKGGTTAQGQAFASIASAAKRTLALTGTLMGGYSTNLFYILWRLMPQEMAKKDLSFKSPKRFAGSYGVLEETRVEKKEDEYGYASISRSRGVRTVVKEKPGVSPLILTDFLLENSVFLRLSDVSSQLPPYEEEVVEVEMLPEQKQAYEEFEYIMNVEVREALANGDHSLLGALVNSLLAYPDGARRGETVIHPYTGEIVASAPEIDADWLPKEQKLVEIIHQEVSQGRKCLVYLEHTGTRDLTPELMERLEQAGIRAFVLKSTTVSPEKREQWVKNHLAGYDVMITNPRLVQTGLDLIEFPTVIFFQTGYSIFTLRQASRRSWRIGQKQPVKVYYLCYSGTMQAKALSLIAEKLETALAVEGDLSDKGLVAISESSNSLLFELARTLIGEKKTETVAESWKKYRQKELEVDSLFGSEEEESISTTIRRGDRSATITYTKVVRGKIYPRKDYAVAYVGKHRFVFKKGKIYYLNRQCGSYNSKGEGQINNKPIRIAKAPGKPYYLLLELKAA